MIRTCLKLFFLSVVLHASFSVHAQDETDIYAQIGTDDARQFVEDYLRPFYNGIGFGFTSGWYNTAATHDQWGFDFTVSANLVFVPSEDLAFQFRNSDYEKIQVVSADEARLSTVFGSQVKEERPELRITDDDGQELIRLTSPPGAVNLKEEISVNALPLPMYQLGFGLIRHTDIKVRVLPKINFEGGSVYMLGFGLQHDLAQWFRLLDAQDISIAFLGAFNNLTARFDLEDDEDPRTAGDKGVFNINGTNLQLIASKEYVNFLTIFGGFGYSRAGSRTQLLGAYPIDERFTQLPEDPLDLRYGNSSMNLSVGLRIKLVFLTFGVSHTFQKYQVSTATLGISVR